MAIINSCGRTNSVDFKTDFGDGFSAIRDWLRQQISIDMWKWFQGNREMEVVVLKKWVLNFTVRVKHLEPLFVVLFGAEG